MIKKTHFYLLLFIIFFSWEGKAQNIFDYENTVHFADYLFKTQQYDLAASEYERARFMQPKNDTLQLKIVQSYRHNADYNMSLQRLFSFQPTAPRQLPNTFANEYVKIKILDNSIPEANMFLSMESQLTNSERNFYSVSILLLEKKWDEARDVAPNLDFPERVNRKRMDAFLAETEQVKYKNPYLAATISSVIPGLGKVYAGSWQDGIIAFMFVGSNAWQCYRGFAKDGIENPYAWTFAATTTLFYLGNIYGSFKTATRFNNRQDHKLLHHAEDIVFSAF